MPVNVPSNFVPQAPTPSAPPAPPTPDDNPSIGELWGAAFSNENAPVAAYRAVTSPSYPPVEGYNQFDHLAGYEDHARQFIFADSPRAVASVKADIDRYRANQRILNDGSIVGSFLAEFAAGLASPTTAIPGGVVLQGAKGVSRLRTALLASAAGAGAAGIDELALQTQVARTTEESLYNIAGATVLSGTLGAGVAHFVNRRMARSALDAARHAQLRREVDDLATTFEGQYVRDGLTPEEAARAARVDAELAGEVAAARDIPVSDVLAAAGREAPSPDAPRAGASPRDPNPVRAAARDVLNAVVFGKLGESATPAMAAVREAVDEFRIEKVEVTAREAGATEAEVREFITTGTTGDAVKDARIRASETRQIEHAREQHLTGGGGIDARLTGLLQRIDDTLASVFARNPQLRDGFSDEALADLDAVMLRRGSDDWRAAAREVGDDMFGHGTVGAAEAPAVRAITSLDRWQKAGLRAAKLLRDPMANGQLSRSINARRLVNQLAEVAVGGGAQSVENRMRSWRGRLHLGLAEVDREYVRYKFGDATETKNDAVTEARVVAGQMGDLARAATRREGTGLSYLDFLEGVANAKRLGPLDSNVEGAAQINRAAANIERAFYAPLRDKAIQMMLLDPELERIALDDDMMDRWINRVWNTDAVTKRSPEFRALVRQWLTEQEAIKEDIKERIGPQIGDVEYTKSEFTKATNRVRSQNARIVKARARLLESMIGHRANATRKILIEARQDELEIARADIREEIAELREASSMDADRLRRLEREFDSLGQELQSLNKKSLKVLREEALGFLAGDEGLGAAFKLIAGVKRADDERTVELAEALFMSAESQGFDISTPEAFFTFMNRGDIDPLETIEQGIAAALERRFDLANEREGWVEALSALSERLTAARAARGKLDANARVAGAVQRERATVLRRQERRIDLLNERVAQAEYNRDVLMQQAEARSNEHDAAFQRLEDTVLEWEGHTTDKAKAAVRARDKERVVTDVELSEVPWRHEINVSERTLEPRSGRQASVDKRLMRAAKAIQERPVMDADDIASTAARLESRLTAAPGGRMGYDIFGYDADRGRGAVGDTGRTAPHHMRGSLRSRVFNIADDYTTTIRMADGTTKQVSIGDFLVNDIRVLATAYERTLAADVEMAHVFGPPVGEDEWLGAQLRAVEGDYEDAMAQSTSERERGRIKRERATVISDIRLMRDRLRGTAQLPDNPDGMAYRVGQAVMNLNIMRLLGGMTVSAMPDIAHTVMYNGFDNVGLAPGLRGMASSELRGLAKAELQAAGTATDIMMSTRLMALADITQQYHHKTKIERGIAGLTGGFGKVSGMNYWNQTVKELAGMMVMSRMMPAILEVADGTASARNIRKLEQLGIYQDTANAIAPYLRQHGELHRGVYFPQTAKWTDGLEGSEFARAEEMAQLVRNQLAAEVDRIIVTPGLERPGWTTTPMMKVITQFRSFQMAAMQRIFAAGLQQRDAYMLMGMTTMIGLGAMSYAIKQLAAGREVSDDWAVLLSEGIDRSGVMGWMFDVNNMLEKATRGSLGLAAVTGGPPMSRYASRNVVGAFLGPSYGFAGDVVTAVGAFANPTEMTQSDTKAMFRLMVYQNVFYLRWLFNQMREGIDEGFNIQPR